MPPEPSRTPAQPPERPGAHGPLRAFVLATDPLARAGLMRMVENAITPMLGTVVSRAEEANVVVIIWDAADADDAERLLGVIDRSELEAPILAVTTDEDAAARALGAGARGVILRERLSLSPGPFSALAGALTAVYHGLTVLDQDLAALPRSAPGLLTTTPELAEELTPRERQVIELMAEGLSNRRIAKELGISEHTAKFHVMSVMAKLGASTRTEAVVEAVRRGLVLL